MPRMHAVRAACTARSQLTVWHGGVRMRRPFIVEATADWPAPRFPSESDCFRQRPFVTIHDGL